MKILLASQSQSRRRLLSRAGLSFELFAPNIEEEKLLDANNPKQSCLRIAKQKALKAQALYKESLIIACDQMVYFEGRLIGKAYTEEKAVETLRLLQGKSHSLLSGLCMLLKDKEHSCFCESRLHMWPLSLEQIKSYVKKERPLQAAGCYHIESEGIKLFEKIESEDFNAIEGLPLMEVFNQLAKWGAPLFEKRGS